STWENLERTARANEAAVMAELIENLRQLYGSIEQAKIRGWDFLRRDDRIKGIVGETAAVNVTAKSWDYAEIRNLANEIIDEITFNAFTKTSNDDTFKVSFEVLNTLLIERLNEALDATILAYYDEYRDDALNLLKQMLLDIALEEMDAINQANSAIVGDDTRDEQNWNDLYAIRNLEAVSPIDDTRADVEAAGTTDQYARDIIVWQRLLEGAGEWQDEMIQIYADTAELGVAEYQRYFYAVEAYKTLRIESFTQEMNDVFYKAYRQESLNAWNAVAASPSTYGETSADIEYILLKDVLKEAWEALEGYSTVQERTVMRSYLNPSAYGVLQYSRGWVSYYSSLPAGDRKNLMDDLKLYYYGYDEGTAQYSGYIAVYNYILLHPSSVGETAESLSTMIADIASGMQGEVNESIIAEIVRRFFEYKADETTNIYQTYLDNLKRDAWAYILERKLYPPNMVALLPDSVLKPDAWELLYEDRANVAYEEHALIDGHFNAVAAELIDRHKKDAFDYLLSINQGNEEEIVLDGILSGLDEDEIRTILWYELYADSNDGNRLSMDSTLNQAVGEGRVLGVDAESISWDRLLYKNETSAARKQLMAQMYERYTKARALEIYALQKDEESTAYEDGVLTYYISSYKKSKVWVELFDDADAERQSLMADIYLNYGTGYEEKLHQAAALDELMAQVPEEADIITLRVQAIQLEYENIEVIQQIKAAEWDDYYSSASSTVRQEMDNIYNKYTNILIVSARKAASLDDADFHNLIGAGESLVLMGRLTDVFDGLLETFFMVKTYDDIFANPAYTAELGECYDYVEERYLYMYFGGDDTQLDEDSLKRYAVFRLMAVHRSQSEAYYESLVDMQLASYINEYQAAAWDRYYAYNQQENEEKAELMAGILYDAVTEITDTLKAEALDALYQVLRDEAAAKITTAENNLTDTIKKNALWIAMLGEDLTALESMLGSVLTIDDDALTLKDMAWLNLSGLLESRVVYYMLLLDTKAVVLSENPQLNEDQRDALSWDDMYQTGIAGLIALMDETLAEYGLFAENSKHLAFRDMQALLGADRNLLDIMETVRSLVLGENTQLAEAQINALAFDRMAATYPEYVVSRLTVDTVNGIKQDAWQDFVAVNAGNSLMTALIDEMYALEMFYHGNDERSSAAVCWDRFVNMTINITETLASVDPRYSEDELRAFSVNCILNLLGGDERAVLQNALDATVINYSAQELDAMVYDIVYSAGIPSEKAVMSQIYDAEALGGGTLTEIKARALNSYKALKQQNA
ncbi:MAG: hypothetical protein PHC84_06085, partial [Clostridia bacterium]|nr:hypothetical protein [Clostridia bacterium]